jgi:hypothetical protein
MYQMQTSTLSAKIRFHHIADTSRQPAKHVGATKFSKWPDDGKGFDYCLIILTDELNKGNKKTKFSIVCPKEYQHCPADLQ